MPQSTLKFGFREAVTAPMSSDTNLTVGEHIKGMLEKTTDTNLRSEVTGALENPSATDRPPHKYPHCPAFALHLLFSRLLEQRSFYSSVTGKHRRERQGGALPAF